MINNVFKEVNKQSSSIDINYKSYSLRCLADLVQFSSTHAKEVYFAEFWNVLLENYFKQDLESLITREKTRHENLVQQLKDKNIGQNVDMKEESENLPENQDANESASKKNKTKQDNEEDEEDTREEEKRNEAIKLIILESVGKCWSYKENVQGTILKLICILIKCEL